ncbi:MAG: hypothetical protein M1814_003979 [Vezdaea aestivalis]|nr:MAG: hypothetical protein M1814_003979 [Vezdaea aestivalis]
MHFFGLIAALLLCSSPLAQGGQANSRPTATPDEVELGQSNTDLPIPAANIEAPTQSEEPGPIETGHTDALQVTAIETARAGVLESRPSDPIQTEIAESSTSGTIYVDVPVDIPETSVTGTLLCHGSLPKMPYFAWQWGYERSGQAFSLTDRDFQSLSDLCSSPYMRWAYGELFDFCRKHCVDWEPHNDWVPIEPYLARLEEYHDLWDRIRSRTQATRWAPMTCNPNEIDPNYSWPKPRYARDFPTLVVLCRENYRPVFSPSLRFGLGCECVEEGKPPVCPRDNANWPITKNYGSRRTPLKYAQTAVTRVSVWEVEDYRLIQDAFIPECETKCTCRRITDRDILRLEELAAGLERHFPGWYTARGAATYDKKVEKSYGAFGTGCSSNQQCYRGYRCVAKLISSTVVMGLSSDLVYKAGCVAVTQSIRGKRLGGRDYTGSFMGEQGLLNDWLCPCNATYVSKGCCSSDEGFLHEDPGLKRGVLTTATNYKT